MLNIIWPGQAVNCPKEVREVKPTKTRETAAARAIRLDRKVRAGKATHTEIMERIRAMRNG